MRSRIIANRSSASASLRIASPSTLTFRRKPSLTRAAMWPANAGSSADSTTPLLSRTMRDRTSGITIQGSAGASAAPARNERRSNRPKDRGTPTSRTIVRKRAAARRGESNRSTSSVKAKVSARSVSSCTTAASRACCRRSRREVAVNESTSICRARLTARWVGAALSVTLSSNTSAASTDRGESVSRSYKGRRARMAR